ncbi:DUF5979 domain-containing protein [Herbiconiux sp.]|uniref:DUF5979 domain-containing protein n=1 Tax=Herbiconiux sp. TaxID=1871186 RepID=UPI0025BBE9CD|nr:DUF5979 domain-containing protein [Herbiconiux sp.]
MTRATTSPARRALSGLLAVSLALGAGLLALSAPLVVASPAEAQDCQSGSVNPMGGATPIGSDAGYTIYTTGDGVLGNSELEGTLAVGGTATFGAAGGGSGSYAIFQGGVGGNADYGVPTIDGDLNRVLMSRFGLPEPDAPQRVAQVQVRVDGTPAAGVKIVDQSTPPGYGVMAAYDSSGSTYSLSPGAGGTNLSPQISSTPQLWNGGAGAASWSTAQPFTDYFPSDTGADILADAGYVSPASISVGGEAAIALDASGPNAMTLPQFGAAAKFTMTQYSTQSPLVVQISPSDLVDGTLRLPSYAYPGKDVPNGLGISYVLFDLSDITGDVVITSRGGEPVRGSIYAPQAHVIFPPGAQGGVEFEGQVVAGDFTALQGGKELHTNLFAGLFPCATDPVGGFSLQKILAGGITAEELPAGTDFETTASWTIDAVDYEETYNLPSDGAVVQGPQDLPAGTIVSFSEITPPDAPGWAFESVSFSPPTITIAAGENPVVVATNTYQPVGGFSLAKQLSGVAPDDVPAGLSYRVLAVWVNDGTPQVRSFDLPADGTVVAGPQNLPVGSVVTFVEIGRPSIDGYVFDGVSFSSRRITIGQGTDPVVTATNSYLPVVPEAGGFSLSKQVAGIDPGAFPEDTTFEVTASWTVEGAPVSEVFELPVDGTTVTGPQDLPVGTVVTFEESDPSALTPPDATLESWGVAPEEIMIGDGENTQVTATNTYSTVRPVGGFDLQKVLAPESAISDAEFPPGTTFPVVAVHVVDGRPVIDRFDLPADGTVVPGPDDLAVGSRVAFLELGGPDAPAGYIDEGVSFSADGASLGPAVITIGDGTTTSVAATNTYRPVGGFSLNKSLAGIDAGAFPADTTFSVVAWTRIDGVFDWSAFPVPADGSTVEGPQDLPIGTVVNFFEVDPPAAPGYEYTGVTFSPESVSIGQGENPTVTATNSYRQLLGGFSVQKTITGTGAASVPSGTTFEVEYFLDDATTPAGVLTVPSTGEVVDGPQDLPEGTVVTFDEVTPLPVVPGAAWETAQFDPEQIVIADGGNETVVLANSIRLLAGGFSLHKVIDGSGAGTVPAGTTFDVAYHLDGSVTPAGTLTVSASGEVVDGPQDLPAGTVVTFREISTLPELPGGKWTGQPTFSPERIVIADGRTTAVTLTNTFAAYPLPDTGLPWPHVVVAVAFFALLLGLLVVATTRRATAART